MSHNEIQHHPTIGVVVGGIMDDFTVQLCRGIMQKSEQLGFNVVVFPGKYIDRDFSDDISIMYEYQCGTVFSYAAHTGLDGIIAAASCVGCYTTIERIKSFLKQYDGIPCVLAASKIDGYHSVNFDNFSGINEGLNYLIREMGCTKIGMIGGPLTNVDAYERKEAYLKTLAENGIPFVERRYVEGDLSSHCSSAYKLFIDHNPDVEAVFCVNDGTAIGLCEELRARGIRPGIDIKIMGYDNAPSSATMNPSLSTVMADTAEIGRESVTLLSTLMNGEEGYDIDLPTHFIKRDSFGVSEDEMSEASYIDSENIDRIFDDVFYKCRYSNNPETVKYYHDVFTRFIDLLVKKATNPYALRTTDNELSQCLNELINSDSIQYIDVVNLLSVYDKIHRALFDKRSYTIRENGSDIFYTIYDKTMTAINYYSGSLKEHYDASITAMKKYTSSSMQFERGNDSSLARPLCGLEWLGIHNAGLYLLKEPIIYLSNEEFRAPDKLYLKAIRIDDNVRYIPSTEQETPTNEIYSRIMSNTRLNNMVMLPLYCNEICYGVIVCDMAEELFGNGEFISHQMSASVKTIDLLRNNEKIQQQLEESLATLRANNIELDVISKTDPLTGIFNRRGFYDAAEQFNNIRPLIVIYGDMNNLKIINDKYGHDNGDISLKTIGNILSDAVGDEGCTGRIGGDEFVCLIPARDGVSEKSLLKLIRDKFNEFNASSSLPYNVTISLGAYTMQSTDDITIKQALTLADEKLYDVKKYRTKDVAKSVK
ncbi:MAG: GGDEF domain-containing protein [Butyrivibrio sp.]